MHIIYCLELNVEQTFLSMSYSASSNPPPAKKLKFVNQRVVYCHPGLDCTTQLSEDYFLQVILLLSL